MWFRRREDETYNEQVLREAGLGDTRPLDPQAGLHPAQSAWGAIAGFGPRPAEWDVFVTVAAPAIGGDEVEFATLPEGDIIVDSESGDSDLSPLADAVEPEVERPYRVVARRGEGDLWSVAARGIDVLRLDFSDGDELELASVGGRTDLKVDGEPSDAHIPELEQAGEAASGEDYVVQAERLDGDLWEVRASPL
jgi:hypothetical protein